MMIQSKFNIGQTVFIVTKDQLSMEPNPYVVQKIEIEISDNDTFISYRLTPPGYESCNVYRVSDESMIFNSVNEGRQALKLVQNTATPQTMSSLDKKYRRRWTGNAWKDELVS